MLEREFQIMSGLRHRNIVRFFGRKDIRHKRSLMIETYLAMEYCQADLKMLLEIRGPLSTREAAIVVKPLLKGLEYLHSQNVIHRSVQ